MHVVEVRSDAELERHAFKMRGVSPASELESLFG